MNEVRQAHLPGNYEFYDDSGIMGSALCKRCWEEGRRANPNSLSTVWIEYQGLRNVWWLCEEHSSVSSLREAQIVRTVFGVVRYPGP